jgi:hypothetical protein
VQVITTRWIPSPDLTPAGGRVQLGLPDADHFDGAAAAVEASIT